MGCEAELLASRVFKVEFLQVFCVDELREVFASDNVIPFGLSYPRELTANTRACWTGTRIPCCTSSSLNMGEVMSRQQNQR